MGYGGRKNIKSDGRGQTKKMNSIKKNFIYNLIYQVLIVLFPLVTSPYISRVLGSDGLGVYSYRYSIANYFVIFAMLGISTHGNRSVAMVRDDREKISQTFWNIYVAHLIISVSITVIYLFYVLKMVDVNRDIAMIEMVYVVSAIFDINWFFFGIERFDLTVTRNIVVKVLSVTSIFVFVHERTDVWKYALIMSLGTLISQSFVWIYLKKYVDFRKPTLKGIIAQIKPMLVLFLPVIAISVYKLMDKIMLGAMTTMSEVGVYENAEKINSLTSGIITALGTVMLPRMTNLAANGKKNEIKKYINISIQFVSLLAAAIAFGIASIGDVFAPIFFGEEFLRSGYVIEFLAPTIIFVAWADVIRMQYLIPNHQDRIYIISMIMGAIVNVCLNAMLIPVVGAIGAAIGTIGAEGTVFVIQAFGSRKELPLKKYAFEIIPYMINGLLMYATVTIVKRIFAMSIFGLFVEIAIGGLVYVVLTLLYWKISKNEFGNMAFNLISKTLHKKIAR